MRKLYLKESDIRALRQPLGATLVEDGCLFAVWSPKAREIVIHLYDKKGSKIGAFSLNYYEGGVWAGVICGVIEGDSYLIEAIGEYDPSNGYYFLKGHYLIDPYAKRLTKAFNYDEEQYLNHNEEFMPRAIISKNKFDWQGSTRIIRPRRQVFLYEAHVKSMTAKNPNVPENLRGTYLGMCHESVIKHLKRLGINTIQLMPITAFMSEPYIVKKGLCNYWGYNPISFFVPEPRYACNPQNSVEEFKTMVKTFHDNDISVIMDVVYNHTAEGGKGGPILSFKGLDCREYYVFERNQFGLLDFNQFTNVTGCGNSFNVSNNVSLRLIHDVLTYWVKEMHVDGFRFDLATTVGRELDSQGHYSFSKDNAIFKMIFCNAELFSSLLIAEPWDIGSFGYQLGAFPAGWSEQNDKFRDTIRRFWRGDSGFLGDFATRLMGSRDVFHKGERSMNASVNYVTYHDGFTLEDLVSYNEKHNELNAEDNKDGSNENYSTNCGIEGPTKSAEVISKRNQLKRNLIATVFLSQGTPHLLSGDELCMTHNGNNNAYCQDNEINYLDWNWNKEKYDFMYFISLLIKIRSESAILKFLPLEDDPFAKTENAFVVRWSKETGHPMTEYDWNNLEQKTLSVFIYHKSDTAERWCFLFNNSDRDAVFRLPSLHKDDFWQVRVDTSEDDGVPRRFSNECGLESIAAAHSIKVLSIKHTIFKRQNTYAMRSDAGLYDYLYRHRNRKSK